MKLSFATLSNSLVLIASTLVSLHGTTTVNALDGGDYAIRAILNNGHQLSTGEKCTAAEWDTIVQAASASIQDNDKSDELDDRRRNLRASGTVIKPLPKKKSGGSGSQTIPGMPVPPPTPAKKKPTVRRSPNMDASISSCNNEKLCILFAGFGFGVVATRRGLETTHHDRPLEDIVELTVLETAFQEATNEDETGDDDSSTPPAVVTNVVAPLVDSTCSDAITRINTAFDAVVSTISPDCQAVVHASRNFTCFDVVYADETVPETVAPTMAPTTAPTMAPMVVPTKQSCCQIRSFGLWNADTDTVTVPDFVNGSSLCLSNTAKVALSLQAVTDDCVRRVQFDMTGPMSYRHIKTEWAAPYFSHGNKGRNVFGAKLSTLGLYTVTAYPDEDSRLTKTLTFEIKDC